MPRIKIKPRKKADDLYKDLFSTPDYEVEEINEIIEDNKICPECGAKLGLEMMPGISGEGVGRAGSTHTKTTKMDSETVCSKCGLVIQLTK
jgi:ribosomal protein S27AE